jgi:hypothetical protein
MIDKGWSISLEPGSARDAQLFIVGSRDTNASVVCENIGAFVTATFIPSESNAAVASATGISRHIAVRRI